MLQNFLVKIILKKGLRSDKFLVPIFYRNSILKNTIVILDSWALSKSQYWSHKVISDIQLERIKTSLIAAQLNIPFWKDRFLKNNIEVNDITNWEYFLKIPITKRTDFKNQEKEYFTDKNILLYTSTQRGHTSGSTAEPFEFFQDYYYELRSLGVCRRILLTIGKGKLLPLIQIRARYRQGFADKKSWWFFAYNHNQLKHRIENLCNSVKKFNNAFILYGFSSYIIEIARLNKEKTLQLRPRALITTGEGLKEDEREFIESSLDSEVFNIYVTNELGWLAFDCEYHNLHINSEFTYIEIVDEEGHSVKKGLEGRVIATTFDNKVMPFIRYDTGDTGILLDDICKCKRTLPIIKISGRQTDIIKLPNNRTVPALDILSIFYFWSKEIRQYQVIQKNLQEFLIKIVPETDQELTEDRLNLISNKIRAALDPSVKINFLIVDEIESTGTGKKRSFITEIK